MASLKQDDSLHAEGTWTVRHPLSNFYKEDLVLVTRYKTYTFQEGGY